MYVGWVRSMGVGFLGGGLEGYMSYAVYCGFIFYFFKFNPVCLFIIISLNDFDVGLIFLFCFVFLLLKLMNL